MMKMIIKVMISGEILIESEAIFISFFIVSNLEFETQIIASSIRCTMIIIKILVHYPVNKLQGLPLRSP